MFHASQAIEYQNAM